MATNSKRQLEIVNKPYDAEIEYLESTGTQWIDTGVSPTRTDSVAIDSDIAITEINPADNSLLFGSYWGRTAGNAVRLFAFVDASAHPRIAYGGALQGSATVSAGTRYAMSATMAAGAQQLTIDGDIVSSGANSPDAMPPIAMAVFACRYVESGGVIGPTKMRLYSMQILVSSTLVRDFIPVRFTNEQGQTEGALYDKRAV